MLLLSLAHNWKKRDKVVLKTEDTTLDINFQQNGMVWYSMFAYFQSSSIAYKELVYA